MKRAFMRNMTIPVIAVLVMKTGTASEVSRAELLARSPFITRAHAGAARDEIIFSGLFGSGDTIEVSLSEAGGKRAAWVRLRDPEAPYYVESVTEDGTGIIVRIAGMGVRVALKTEGPGAADTHATTEVFVRADGKEWSPPEEGKGRHPNDPGNQD